MKTLNKPAEGYAYSNFPIDEANGLDVIFALGCDVVTRGAHLGSISASVEHCDAVDRNCPPTHTRALYREHALGVAGGGTSTPASNSTSSTSAASTTATATAIIAVAAVVTRAAGAGAAAAAAAAAT